MKIDSHQHFWNYNPIKHDWIDEKMPILKRNFLPHDLYSILKVNHFEGCVAVQADHTEEETEFLLNLSLKNDFVKGVVGWVDLRAENIEDRLTYYHSNKSLKGVRHILQSEAQRDFMLRKDFQRGISKLEKYNLTYDILIFTDQIQYSEQLVKLFPNQLFVIDHLAKPKIAVQDFYDWANDIRLISKHENVFCKLSGMVTEAKWNDWQEDDFRIYLDVVTQAFGTDRLLYGSDWPVSLLSSTYSSQLNIVQKYFSSFTEHEKANIFGKNAVKFYDLD
jgi:L-fuconolactonase